MICYRNTSCATKTFYGVKFLPGEVKAVNGYINDAKFVQVDSSELPKLTQEVKVTKKVTEPSKPTAQKTKQPTKEDK